MAYSVIGTVRGDFLFFEGDFGHITTTITNSYSGETLLIDDDYNINTASYEGLAGIDTMFMTNYGDAIFLTDSVGNQLLSSVERIIAGDGGDLIKLDDANIILDNMYIDGGRSADVIWANAGDDIIRGYEGDDILDGGPGDDRVYGQLDDDIVRGGEGDDLVDGGFGDDLVDGGTGNDTVLGDQGNDVLYGGPAGGAGVLETSYESHSFSNAISFPQIGEKVKIGNVDGGVDALGIAVGDLAVDFATTAEISIVGAEANLANSFGSYIIGADGTIESVTFLAPDVTALAAGDTATIDLPGGDTALGFFLIANGAQTNPFDDFDNGSYQFIYDYGGANERLANINDAESDISLIYSDGSTEQVITGSNNHIYHTTARGGEASLNSDGDAHVISGVVETEDGTALRIGFEEHLNTKNGDFNDLVFDLTIESQQSDPVLLIEDADYLDGGAGDDVLDGGVDNDILIGGEGADILYGGHGADQFVFTVLDGWVDTVKDFEAGAGGDILNITDILQGYDALTDLISDFVQFTDNGAGDTVMAVNATGQSGGVFEAVALIEGGVGNAALADLLVAGQLVADQSVVV